MSRSSGFVGRSIKVATAAAALGLATFGLLKFSRLAYESAPYSVVERDGPFELRRYPDVPLVSTPMTSSDPSDRDSFMRLFRFISGDNGEKTKISMTTPVFAALPSGHDGDPHRERGAGRMSFVVPDAVARAGTPEATDAAVKAETLSSGLYATFRFNGSRNARSVRNARVRLAEWMAGRNLLAVDEPLFAGYDPPFTPPFLRRNEVLIRVGGNAAVHPTSSVPVVDPARRNTQDRAEDDHHAGDA